jgi:predicted flavoprotein YhiN
MRHFYVIGSGPSGIAIAKKLLESESQVTLITGENVERKPATKFNYTSAQTEIDIENEFGIGLNGVGAEQLNGFFFR